MVNSNMLMAAMMGLSSGMLPIWASREPRTEYGEVKAVKVRVNTNRPKKKGKRK